MGNKTFRFDTVMAYMVVLDAGYLGRGGRSAHPLHPPPRSVPGSDQNTRIVIYVIMTKLHLL